MVRSILYIIAALCFSVAQQLQCYNRPTTATVTPHAGNHHFCGTISSGHQDSPMNQIRQMRQHGMSKHHTHQKQSVVHAEPKNFSNTQVIQPLPRTMHNAAYQQLFSLERELASKGCYTQHQQDRLDAIHATQRNQERVTRSISIDDDVRFFAQQYDIPKQSLSSGLMNDYEYQLHKEFLEQLSQAARLKYYYDNAHDYCVFIDTIGHGVSCGIDANSNHQAIQATQWADFGWQVLDLAKAALEGSLLGVYNTAAFVGGVVADPLEAIKTVTQGAVAITSFLARATGAVLRFQALEEGGHHEQLHAELDELANRMNVIINHCLEHLASMPLREKVKHVVAFGTEIIVPMKVFKVAHTLCSRMRPMVANMMNALRDEQVVVEIAGIGGENLLLRGGEEIQKATSAGVKIVDKIRRPLIAVWVDVKALARRFEGRMVVDGKSVHIDYAHLFSIEEISRVKHTGHMTNPKLYGWHHDGMKALERAGVVKHENIVSGSYGAFRSNPVVNGIGYGEKTFFPAAWTEEQVVEKIFEVFEQAFLKGFGSADSKGCYKIIGETREGLKIKIIFDPQQSMITTAYPLIEGMI